MSTAARKTSSSPPAPRWRRLPTQRPREILAAAARTFAREGLRGARLSEVAREAGISKGTIYLYYRSKEDLFAATLRALGERVREFLERSVEGGARGTIDERMGRIAEEADRVINGPEAQSILRMVLAEAGSSPTTAELFFREVILRNNRRLARVLERGMEAGEIRRLDPLLAARCLSGMILSFSLAQKVLGGERVLPVSRKRIVSTVTSVFLHGVARPRRARARGGRR